MSFFWHNKYVSGGLKAAGLGCMGLGGVIAAGGSAVSSYFWGKGDNMCANGTDLQNAWDTYHEGMSPDASVAIQGLANTWNQDCIEPSGTGFSFTMFSAVLGSGIDNI